MWKWILLTVVILIVALFGTTLQQVTVEEVLPTGFRIGQNGLMLEGVIVLKNPNVFDINVESGSFNIYFTETRQVIGYGQISKTTIAKRQKTTIPFNQTLNWKPTVGVVIQLLSKPVVHLTIAGTIAVRMPVIGTYDIPFSKTFDIKDSLRLIVRGILPI